jgi:hypothetical protein
MGARPSSFKGGGGFLNNVDGEISDYSFLDVFPGQEAAANAKFTPLYFNVTVAVDGAEEPQSTTLFAGSADDFEISDDGKTLTPVTEGGGPRKGTPFFRFLETLISPTGGGAGFDEELLPADDEPINYEAILGTRARFVQERDEKAIEKNKKNYRKSAGKLDEQGYKKGKDGKFYPPTNPVIEAVLGEAVEAPAPKAAAVKGKTAAAAAKVDKKAPKADPIVVLSDETLLAILADNDGSIGHAKLPAKIVTKLGSKHPEREPVRKLMLSDAYLAREAGWSYDASKKIITLK